MKFVLNSYVNTKQNILCVRRQFNKFHPFLYYSSYIDFDPNFVIIKITYVIYTLNTFLPPPLPLPPQPLALTDHENQT